MTEETVTPEAPEELDLNKLSPQEQQEHKNKLIKYFESEMEFLTAHKNYQQLITELEELRARYVRAQMMIAQAMAPNPDAGNPAAPKPQERQLKKV